jgi:hypothetical protein
VSEVVESGSFLGLGFAFELNVMSGESLLDFLNGSVVVFARFALAEYSHVDGDEGTDAVSFDSWEFSMAPVNDAGSPACAGWWSC